MKTNGIFISYRRADSAYIADSIYGYLIEQIPGVGIFRDVEEIVPGTTFIEKINENLASCSVMLVLIGLEWAGAQSKKGECRLFKDDDFVRLEIETAIGRRIPVIPVLLESAELPTKDQLPASIQPLLHYHWIRLNPEPEFSIGLSRLRDAICVHMPERRGKRTELLRRYLLISPARNRVAARSKAVFYVMLFFSLTAIAGVISPAPFNIGVTDDLAMMTRTDALFSAVLFIPMTLFFHWLTMQVSKS
ncbi:MAG: hypothetical protein RLZZ436_1636 [Planctomycetota bacterium]|jgi:hypothetical protein